MKRLLVSACLLGANCKYSGGNNALDGETLRLLREKWALTPVCPETAGGLGVPREPSERREGRVVNRRGEDVTAAFSGGAETDHKPQQAVRRAKERHNTIISSI